MLINFLKIAYRNLFKYKYYTLLNITGFAIGLAVVIFVGVYAARERSYDKFHKNAGRIYRIINTYEKDSTLNRYAANPFPLAKTLALEYPGIIESTVRLFNFQNNFHLVEYRDKHFNEKNFFYTDSTITAIFDFTFLNGSIDSALKSPNTVIISESIKEKYFGSYNPIGKKLVVDEVLTLEITGVFEDFPVQSHFHPEILTPFSSFTSFMEEPDNWLWNSCWTYVLLKKDASVSNLEKKLPGFVNKYFDKDLREYSSIEMQPVTEIHLNSNLESEIEANSKALYINILEIVSFFLLIVSWLNYINLSFVGSITRIREVSIRKILGSTKRAIVYQFIADSLISSFAAFMIALFIVEILIPGFNFLTNENFVISRAYNNDILLHTVIITVCSGLIVGVYTGVYASIFPTFNLGRFKYKLASKKWLTGKILIMMQYIISLIILIVVLVNFRQLVYFRNADLGFSKDNLLILTATNTSSSENFDEFKQALGQIPGILSVSAADHIIGSDRAYRRYFYEINGQKKVQFFPELIVKEDFIKTLGIKIIAGNDLSGSSNIFNDSGTEQLIINETMVKHLNAENEKDVLTKKLVTFKENEKIVGVIKDISSNSLHRPLSPIIIRLSKKGASEDIKYIIIKYDKTKKEKTIKSVEKLWKSFNANRPAELQNLNEVLDFQYKNESLLNVFLWIFSILTLVISCMGIWAVTSLFSIQRTKEIGIRKALGASISEILLLFVKDFTNILLISNLIAWPVAWLILENWIKNFANHININVLDFIAASVIILFLTLAIVIKHALNVANSNAIDSLRDE
ncbi:MAG: ABC transporter permease [Bacteroidales bacterium]